MVRVVHSRRLRAGLAGLAAVSLGLRLWLASEGGQNWWPDESRFGMARAAAGKFAIGHVFGALRTLFGSADHLGFKLLALPAAFAVNAGAPLWMAAAYLGLFSVGTICLVGELAWLTSADEATAWWSAFTAAVSVSLFYYTRQLFPYDPALFLCLLGLVAGLRERPFLLGLWCGLGFLTYNGYWHVAAVCLIAGLSIRPRFKGAVWAGVGLLAPIAASILIARLLGRDLIKSFIEFSRTVTFGDFDQGWSFPWEYLWKAEGLLLAIWAASWLLALSGLLRAQRRYLWTWAVVLAAVYLGLAIPSAVLHKFVVYGRTARSLAPFFALVCGGVAAALLSRVRHRRLFGTLVAAALIAISRPHFQAALSQWYPDRFLARARQIEASRPPDGRLRVVNAWFLHHPDWISTAPLGETLFERPHPMQFAPFMYENQPLYLRRAYWARDMTMRLARIATAPIAVRGLPPGYAGPTRLVLRFSGLDGPEPLVTTGAPDASDCLFVERLAPTRFRFHLRQSREPDLTSQEIVLAPAAIHVLDVSLGSLLPPLDSAWYASRPDWRPLTRRLWMTVDGHSVFDVSATFHRALPGQCDFGSNLDGESVLPQFRGQLRSVSPLPPGSLQPLLAANRRWDGRITGLPPNGYPGGVRIRLRLPSNDSDAGNPLVVTGRTSAGDILSIVRLGPDRFKVRFDHWHAPLAESAPFRAVETAEHGFEVRMDSLDPPGTSKRGVEVRLDGERVFTAAVPLYPATPDEIHVGENPLGASTAISDFSGTIRSVSAALR